MQTTGFNIVDYPMFNLDRPQESMSVHIEVRASGRIDAEKLCRAIWRATETHPMARARMQAHHEGVTRYKWEIPARMEHLPLEVVDAGTQAEVSDARARLQSLPISLLASPPFAVTLVHHKGGDYLMLNVNHAAGDGMATFRLMTSIVRQYAGEADPVPDLDPLAARDLKNLVGSRNTAERIRRIGMFLDFLWQARKEPVRIKPKGVSVRDPDKAPGYGFHLMKLSQKESRQIMARRVKPATINDMLLAGLIRTIRLWNDNEGGRKGRISVMMPMNLRPQEWWFEVFSNIVSMVMVSLEGDEQTGDLAQMMTRINEQTAQLKEAGATGVLVDMLEVPLNLPSILKKRLNDVAPTFLGRNYVDSTVLSNLGRLASPPNFGDAGHVVECYFTPPCHMPLGASVGAATIGDVMHLTLRYRNAQFSPEAAQEFGELYRAVLRGDVD